MSSFQWDVDLSSSNAISRGPAMPKETDRVIAEFMDRRRRASDRTLSREEQRIAMEDFEDLREDIESRIEELEDFYLKHDAENKAILFEKQRLRLRRLLHSTDSDTPSRATSYRSPAASTPSRQQQQQVSSGRRRGGKSVTVRLLNGRKIEVSVSDGDTIRDLKQNVELMEGIPQDQQRLQLGSRPMPNGKSLDDVPSGSVLKLQRPSPKMAYSTNASPRDKFQNSIHKKRTKDRKTVKAIYDWEKADDNGAGSSDVKYKLDGTFEFQIKLTEKEFFKLTSRRRAIGAEKRHTDRNKTTKETESPYMKGPYVDPMRITKHIYRSPKKNLWIDPKGLRPYAHK